MTETITLPGGQVAESPHIPRPHSDGAALRATGEATSLDNFASKDMRGRQRHIQDCVDQILAEADPEPAAS